MKHHLLIYFTILNCLSIQAQPEQKRIIIDSTCHCIGNAIDSEVNTKYDFEYDFGICIDSLLSRLVKYDKKYSNMDEVNNFIRSELNENCDRYYEADSIKHYYSTHAFQSIASKEDCEIMKDGIFITYGDKDSTRFIMTKKKQTIEYADGTYTKAKIEWLDNCSYKVIRTESTNTEDSKIKPGHEMQVNIIYVKDDRIIFYEILVNNKAYSGRMIRIGD